MEDNDISFDKSLSEFEEIFLKVKNLKLKIEKEIEKINNSCKKVEDEITFSFKKQYSELDEKEKNIKLGLNLRVYQIKDELEKYLDNSKNILLSCEKTLDIAKKYEKKNNNNIKTLYFISEINKSNEKAKEFIIKKIKNLDISLRYDSYVNYDEYCFNGVPNPKNIDVEKKGDKLFISWDIDDSIIKYINIDNIKYSVTVNNIGSIFDFKEETDNKYIYYKDNEISKEYEIKVRTLLEGYCSEWSIIKKSKIEVAPIINIFADNNQKNSLPSLFSQPKQTENLFGNIFDNKQNKKNELFGSKENKNENKNPFIIEDNNKNTQEKSIFELPLFKSKNSLFSSGNNIFNNNTNQGRGIFGINIDKDGLFGNNDNNNEKEGLFQNNNDKKENIFEKDNTQDEGSNENNEKKDK